VIEEDNLVERSHVIGKHIRDELVKRLDDIAVVGEVRGAGTLIAVEYVARRSDLRFLDPSACFCVKVQEAALAQGLLVSVGQGIAEGYIGDFTTLTPPYNTTDSEAELIIQKLTTAICEAVRVARVSGEADAPIRRSEPPSVTGT
jgi:adenosylmethionine-8-amino-7-oxononanoate aminotransferase